MPFDQNRPHGILYGTEDGRAFEQDGKFYQSNGAEWTPPAEAGEVASPAEEVAPRAPRAPRASPLPIKVVALE
jgi:hypothetical protein